MYSRTFLSIAVAALLMATLAVSPSAQQGQPQQGQPQQGRPQQGRQGQAQPAQGQNPQAQQAPATNADLQTGVPAGRGGAPARGRGAGGRAAAAPVPPPRLASGRVQLNEKGVWIGGGGVGGRGDDVPYQAWAKGVSADRRNQRARAAHALQGVGDAASVPHAIRC
jgi:hypothetical protein